MSTDPDTQPLIDRLKNRGPVALSTQNPFLSPNLLLSKEMETSDDLAEFIRHRGIPRAIAIEKQLFSAFTLLLYYPQANERYSIEQADGAWIISEPASIRPDESEALLAVMRGAQGVPIIKSGKELATVEKPFRSPAPAVAPNPRINLNQRMKSLHLKLASVGAAELTSKGDLVHYVTSTDESLRMIAAWYTFDESNIETLRRVNKLSKTLTPGDSVIIPSYLVKNKTRLSEEAVSESKDY